MRHEKAVKAGVQRGRDRGERTRGEALAMDVEKKTQTRGEAGHVSGWRSAGRPRVYMYSYPSATYIYIFTVILHQPRLQDDNDPVSTVSSSPASIPLPLPPDGFAFFSRFDELWFFEEERSCWRNISLPRQLQIRLPGRLTSCPANRQTGQQAERDVVVPSGRRSTAPARHTANHDK